MIVPAKAGSALNIAELEIVPENLVLVSAGKPCALSSEYGCCNLGCGNALDVTQPILLIQTMI
jgi:hypothetical protein